MSQDRPDKEEDEFSSFLGGVASRLRHDLKGGLLTLRMGLEALPDQEDLKPLLLERTHHLVGLADKLILLLRMGRLDVQPTRLTALLEEFRLQASERLAALEIELPTDLGSERPALDGDAVVLALLELAENAHLAGARRLLLRVARGASGPEGLELQLTDDGTGLLPSDGVENLAALGFSRWDRAGLGLSIAERCARAHGGELKLGPSSSGGAVATLRIQEPVE